MDKFSKEKRSEIMSKIGGKWTKPEVFAHNILKGNRVKHKMHPKLLGKPDILIKSSMTVVFIDGCFWHCCPIHFKMPKTRVKFWKSKFDRNVERDREVNIQLMALGYDVVRIWECDLSSKNVLAVAEKNCLPLRGGDI